MVWRFSGVTSGIIWRSAYSLARLAGQVDELAPHRSRITDGTVASSTHTGNNPTSDHEPGKDPYGVVAAIDITHDPAAGADMGVIAEQIRLSRDPRVKYVIYDRRLFSSYRVGKADPYVWRAYSGSNPHTSHMHVSVLPDRELFDDVSDWQIGTDDMTPEQEQAVDWLVALKASLEGFGWTDGDNSAKRLEYANRLRNGIAARTGVSGDNGAAMADALALLSDVSDGQNGVTRQEFDQHQHGPPQGP